MEREEHRTRLEHARQQREADERLRHVDAAQRAHGHLEQGSTSDGTASISTDERYWSPRPARRASPSR